MRSDMTIRIDIDLGLSSLKGVLALKDTGLGVEWRQYDLFDAPKGPLESVIISLADLAGVKVRSRPFRPKLEITAKSASTFGKIPLPAGDLAILKAKGSRSDRSQAEAWGAEASLRIAEAMSGRDLLE